MLTTLNSLLDGLYALNPEGRPFSYRGDAQETLEFLDQATEQGFDIERSFSKSGPA